MAVVIAAAISQTTDEFPLLPHDRARVEHLFALYEKLTAPLAPAAGKAKKARKAGS